MAIARTPSRVSLALLQVLPADEKQRVASPNMLHACLELGLDPVFAGAVGGVSPLHGFYRADRILLSWIHTTDLVRCHLSLVEWLNLSKLRNSEGVKWICRRP